MLGIFLDTETNGLNFFIHSLLEIALQIIDLTTGETLDAYESTISISPEEWKKSDPYSLQINGIHWEELVQSPPPQTVSDAIKCLLKKWHVRRDSAFFICQNPSFDRVFFSKLIDIEYQTRESYPYHWLDLASMFFAKNVLQGQSIEGISLSKDAIAEQCVLPKETHPHRAAAGVKSLIACYYRVLQTTTYTQ